MCDQHGIGEHDAMVRRREIVKNLPVDVTKLEWPLIGCSVVHEEMIMVASMYAQVPEAVYLYGETGVGKQTLARLIHTLKAKDKSFHQVDCADYPQGAVLLFILEAYNAPNAGSVYLSSADKLSRKDQEAVALLMVRSLREGGPRFFLSSTTLSLADMNEEKVDPSFLLHMLQYPLELPPLHKRPEDIPLLLDFYAKKNGATLNLSDADIKELQEKKWDENIKGLIKTISLLLQKHRTPHD